MSCGCPSSAGPSLSHSQPRTSDRRRKALLSHRPLTALFPKSSPELWGPCSPKAQLKGSPSISPNSALIFMVRTGCSLTEQMFFGSCFGVRSKLPCAWQFHLTHIPDSVLPVGEFIWVTRNVTTLSLYHALWWLVSLLPLPLSFLPSLFLPLSVCLHLSLAAGAH